MFGARTIGAVLVAVALAACGGSGGSSSTSTHPATASTSTATHSGASGASVTTGPVHGTLVGANHSPKINVKWPYTVTVTDAAGHPLDGTVAINFTFGGEVVGRDTPPTHPLKSGRWHDNLKFPAQSLGEPLSLQAVVHTSSGSITLSWPVTTTR
jgi:hypothetical protein